MNYEEAKKYFEETFLPAAAAKRLADWKEENPDVAPKAIKEKKEVVKEADEE
jgi:hypothetical protein